MKPWKRLSQKTILEHGPFLRVDEHSLALPDGQHIPDWSWVITPDFVDVAAITEAGTFICLRQYKYGVGGITLASIGGHLEGHEPPLETAKRELLEETGYEAPHWTSLGSYTVHANRHVATAHFFLAEGARQVQNAHSGDLEEQELVFLSKEELKNALTRGDFKASTWLAVMSLALLHVK
jgi:ADP-ribose pyrophosphatase